MSLEHITTQSRYDLQTLCENDDTIDEESGLPYKIGCSTCTYYEPSASRI